MKLCVRICFLKYFWNSRHLVPPFKFQCGQIIRILFDKINLLLIVSTPKIELLMQSFVEIRLTTLSDDIVLPQCTNILPNSQW